MSVSPALRPPPGNPRFPLVDAMRAIAILIVVFAHVSVITGAVRSSWGWLPMNAPVADVIFFALSGFLLYRPFVSGHAGLRRAPDTLAFARRRVLRIIPTYWIALTGLAVLPGIRGVFSGDWWIYYGFGQIYSKRDLTNGITFAGYICVAVTFYLLLPPLAGATARLTARWRERPWWHAQVATIGAFALIGPVGALLARLHELPFWLKYSFITMTAWPAAGMAMAVVSVALERGAPAPRALRLMAHGPIAWLAAAALFLLAAGPFDSYSYAIHPGAHPPTPAAVVASNLLFAACAVFALLPAVFGTGGLVRRLLAWRPLAKLGLVSYGVYVWHFPLAAWLASWHGPPDPIPGTSGGLHVQRLLGGHAQTLVLFAATLVLSTAIATISYRWLELPFLRRKEARPRARMRAAGVPADVG